MLVLSRFSLPWRKFLAHSCWEGRESDMALENSVTFSRGCHPPSIIIFFMSCLLKNQSIVECTSLLSPLLYIFSLCSQDLHLLSFLPLLCLILFPFLSYHLLQFWLHIYFTPFAFSENLFLCALITFHLFFVPRFTSPPACLTGLVCFFCAEKHKGSSFLFFTLNIPSIPSVSSA